VIVPVRGRHRMGTGKRYTQISGTASQNVDGVVRTNRSLCLAVSEAGDDSTTAFFPKAVDLIEPG